MQINQEDLDKLKQIEESLWIAETRFDKEYMGRILSPDFFEFGQGGRKYNREDILSFPQQEINARLPLPDFKIHPITSDVVLVTYISEVRDGAEVSRRSSLWLKTSNNGWQLRFHQVTPGTK